MKNPKLPAAASVSLTLGNGQVIQLTDPLDSQPKVQFVTQFDPSGHMFNSSQGPAPQSTQTTNFSTEEMVPSNHGFQNEFLEDLARSQIVSDSKKVKAKTPAVRTVNKKKPEPKKKKSPNKTMAVNSSESTNATNVTNATQLSVVNVNATGVTTSQIVTTSSTSAGIPRVQTIKLSPQNQQVSFFCVFFCDFLNQ